MLNTVHTNVNNEDKVIKSEETKFDKNGNLIYERVECHEKWYNNKGADNT